ncbi:hypothetical protein cand_035970 [Cryptosporidium andersoni]|uniref:Amino acid transporter transmembrane domain-containing protein n=1 Tax=Cryptosporidium andersoni TaxID=117008 RepID=A0A1J4MV76_9CRYT|nr:hypothetical protein cand_035970 [Cryptosporidium andersoni]
MAFNRGSLSSTFLFLASSCVGVGTLTLPLALMKTGIISGLIVFIISALTCGLTMIILITSAQYYNAKDYPDLLYCILTHQRRYGSFSISVPTQFIPLFSLINNNRRPVSKKVIRYMRILDIFIFMDCFLAVPCYLMFLGDFIPAIAKSFKLMNNKLSSDWPNALKKVIEMLFYLLSCREGAIILSCIIFFILCSPKDVTHIRYFSWISIVAMGITMILIGTKAYRIAINSSFDNFSPKWFNYSFEGISSALGLENLLLFIFFCHFNIIEVGRQMKDPSKLKNFVIVSLIMIYAVTCNFTIALAGYIAFGEDVKPNILVNFPTNDNEATIIRICLIISIFILIPLSVYPMIASFINIFSKDYTLQPKNIPQSKNITSWSNSELQNFCDFDSYTSQLNDNISSCMEIRYIELNTNIESNREQHYSQVAEENLTAMLEQPYAPNITISVSASAPRFIKTKIFRITCLFFLLSFGAFIATRLSSVAVLTEIIGGTIDAIFILCLPAYISYVTKINESHIIVIFLILQWICSTFKAIMNFFF